MPIILPIVEMFVYVTIYAYLCSRAQSSNQLVWIRYQGIKQVILYN